jgi:hypothetical protein
MEIQGPSGRTDVISRVHPFFQGKWALYMYRIIDFILEAASRRPCRDGWHTTLSRFISIFI